MQEKSKPIRRKNTLAAGRPSKAKKAGVIAAMAVASALSVSICYTQLGEKDWLYSSVLLVVIIGLIGFSALEPKVAAGPPVVAPASHRLSRRTLVAGFLILVMIPLTIWVGITYFGDRRYYIVSMAIVVYTMIPFFMSFEGRKPQARELVVIAVLAAIAVAGRAAFFMLPQFKPVVAIVIIAGVCFGGEAGFLVGAVTGFVSNFFFGLCVQLFLWTRAMDTLADVCLWHHWIFSRDFLSAGMVKNRQAAPVYFWRDHHPVHLRAHYE